MRTQEYGNACEATSKEPLHVATATAEEFVSLQGKLERIGIPWLTDNRDHIHVPTQDDAAVDGRTDTAVDSFLRSRLVGDGLVGDAVIVEVGFDPVGDGVVSFSA